MSVSIIKYYGKQSSRCGYCKGSDGSLGYGMNAFQLTPQDYQDLIDRGWRRCGFYCYKQDNEATCCPCYTIRCNALEFKLGKSHKRILKRMNRFLRDGKKDTAKSNTTENCDNDDIDQNLDYIDEDDCEALDAKESSMCNMNLMDEVQPPNIPLQHINFEAAEASANKNKEAQGKQQHLQQQKQQKQQQEQQKQQQQQQNVNIEDKLMAMQSNQGENLLKKHQHHEVNDVAMPSKKAKQKRLDRKLNKLAAKGLSPSTTSVGDKSTKNKEKTLKDFIEEVRPDDKHKLKLVNVDVESAEFMATLDESYKLYEKYQTTIHNDPPRNVNTYLEFLQKTPLKVIQEENGPAMGYGTFHQQYWLDDKLIAIAVLDILPYCVSSVYFFYDPYYSFLSLGTYSSLREIEFVQELSERTPTLKYYYMGFYIHSCPKMRYKAKLKPSYLLCSEVYTWHLITDELRSKLDAQKYTRFNMDITAKDINKFSNENIYEILLLIFQSSCCTYGDFVKRFGEDERDILLEYGTLMGKALSQRMLFVKTLL